MKATNRISLRTSSDSVVCVVGDTLRRVRVYSDAEWERFDPAARPSPATRAPGLGWVAAVFGPIPN